MDTCPIHHLLLLRSEERLGKYCPWPGCTEGLSGAQEAMPTTGVPTVSDVWRKITYDVKVGSNQVAITAHLPPGFTMREFTKIYFISDAQRYGLDEETFVQAMKDRMLDDLMNRIQT